jgi:uncharacterized membrane protein
VAVVKRPDGTVDLDQAVPLTAVGAASGAASGGL